MSEYNYFTVGDKPGKFILHNATHPPTQLDNVVRWCGVSAWYLNPLENTIAQLLLPALISREQAVLFRYHIDNAMDLIIDQLYPKE